MKHITYCFVFLFVILSVQTLLAQDNSNYQFGKINAADFNLTAEAFDFGANALVIADVGSTAIDLNSNGNFPLQFTRFLRIKILNKNGFDIGNFQLLLYKISERYSDRLFSLKGSTFNLENGIIMETKLEKESVYHEKYNYNVDLTKFTMPALKEGSIFDLEYTIKSPIETEPRTWSFQGKYPCLWNEYMVSIAPPLHYKVNLKGEENFNIDTTIEIKGTFAYRDDQSGRMISVAGKTMKRRWVKRNVPALREAPFITSLENYKSAVSFQLEYLQWNPETERHDYLITWNARCKALLNDPGFGLALNQDDNWLFAELKQITRDMHYEDEKAVQIFTYIRDNFKVNADQGLFAGHTLKDVFKNREGNVAEINMLLTVMLRKAGINADPLILSTRENGQVDVYYPLISQYNYVICIARVGDQYVTLDASQPYIGFGQLPVCCYNGYGHIVNQEMPMPTYFSSDSLHESKVTYITLLNDDKGISVGSYKEVLGTYESYDLRKEIFKSSTEDYLKKIKIRYGSDISVENLGFDSLKNYDFPVTVHYDFEIKNLTAADIIYFNPMVDVGLKNNPFKSLKRQYPVEMPYQTDETYVLNMEIPAGYQVDEMPKSARVMYNDNEGIFEYMLQKGAGNLQLVVHLKFKKAFFPVEEYTTLRDFYTYVVKKESEQIVFKKIK